MYCCNNLRTMEIYSPVFSIRTTEDLAFPRGVARLSLCALVLRLAARVYACQNAAYQPLIPGTIARIMESRDLPASISPDNDIGLHRNGPARRPLLVSLNNRTLAVDERDIWRQKTQARNVRLQM